MAVDGGAGNPISLSEVQAYYGGENPISISEYYRGGGEVPGDQVAAQSDTSGTISQTIGEFTVTVSGTFNGALSLYTDFISTSSTVSFTVADNTAIIGIGTQHPDRGGSSSTINYTVNVGGSSVSVTSVDSVGNGAFIADGFWQGPAAFGATGEGPDRGDLTTGTTVSLSGEGTGASNIRIRVKTREGTSDVTFRNNNANTLTTTSGSTGGAQTYTQNQSRLVKDDSSTPNYTLGYNAVLGNTNVPASGVISLDTFNAPGNPSP